MTLVSSLIHLVSLSKVTFIYNIWQQTSLIFLYSSTVKEPIPSDSWVYKTPLYYTGAMTSCILNTIKTIWTVKTHYKMDKSARKKLVKKLPKLPISEFMCYHPCGLWAHLTPRTSITTIIWYQTFMRMSPIQTVLIWSYLDPYNWVKTSFSRLIIHCWEPTTS